jgi:predicted metal-binding membrane protein
MQRLKKGHPMTVRQLHNQAELKGQAFLRRCIHALWPWSLVAAAWALLIIATLTHQTYLLNHQYLLRGSGLPWLVALEVFLLCWQIMIVAMMLPSSIPMLKLVVQSAHHQQRPAAIPLAFLAGYAAIWTAFAAGAFFIDTLLHRLLDLWPWLAGHPWLIGAITFAIAGVFQFTPLKTHSMMTCRTPLSFFLQYYRNGIAPAWQLGLRNGLYCLGSCWALMLVMFGVGIGSLAAMTALTGVMVIEKTVPGGKRLAPFVGIALLLLAGLWLAHPLWLTTALL